jgi:small-conductance mechanosensitive channel
LLIFIATFYVVQVIKEILNYGIERWKSKQQKLEGDSFDSSFFNLLQLSLSLLVWGIVIIFGLQNFGINVAALIGGLGITGIAVAFALQNVLEDIFASFSIYLDKPFKTGDFIIIGSDMGNVQKVGIATTRIKTLQGQELILNNTELVKSRVNNYAKMRRRRIETKIGLEYSTSSQKLQKIPKIIEKIIASIENCDFDRAHFKEFGDFSLIFEIIYFINDGDYRVYMDIRQQINFEIKEVFEKEKINMAFPTQKIEIAK